jgi:hypothetical protein
LRICGLFQTRFDLCIDATQTGSDALNGASFESPYLSRLLAQAEAASDRVQKTATAEQRWRLNAHSEALEKRSKHHPTVPYHAAQYDR